MIVYILGKMMGVEGLLLLIPALVSLIYHEKSVISFLIVAAILLVIYMVFGRKLPASKQIYGKEGFVIVGLAWILWSAFGALPFVISGSIPYYIDALFETISGFTTTGSSILSDPSQMPYSINIWRCFSHWIGGMGVLVFILTLLPLAGGYHMNLMKAESPGPSVGKLLPKVQSTAKILYKIYIALTVALIILLLLGGMPLYDSLCAAFGTAGTGGFGIKSDSMGSYSLYIQIVITIFMILFGVNFNVYFLLLTRKFSQALKSEEVRCYFFVIIASALMITFNVRHLFDNVWEALQQAFFQVGSIITTTGYATTDFNQWPAVSRTILVLLTFCGACAGSTGGGIKISRLLLLAKSVRKELHLYLHPNAVKKIKMDGKAVSHEVMRATNIYMIVYLMIVAASIFIISFDEFDLVTNFTAVVTTLNNVGPGLSLIGPTGNFGIFSPLSKLVLSFDMLAGRLELFPILILFLRETWKKF